MKYTTLLSASIAMMSCLSASAFNRSLFAQINIFSNQALYKKQFIEGLPAEIYDIFFKKDEKNLTSPEALAKGIALLKSKKYRSWVEKNKKVISSGMNSFYEIHFGYNSNATYEQKKTDAIKILYAIQGELDYEALANKLKKFLAPEEKRALEQYYLDSVKGFPLEVHTILFRGIKDGRNLTTRESLIEAIALLKSKKYKSWAQQNKKIVSSVMDSFYETHFGYHSDKCPEQKVADAIEILYVLQGELDCQPLTNKLKSLVNVKEKGVFEQYVSDYLQSSDIEQRESYYSFLQFLINISPQLPLLCVQNTQAFNALSSLNTGKLRRQNSFSGVRKRSYTI